MEQFKLVNRISGWIVFLIAATVYLLTIEPTTSFWDCGEFIATANKLEVGHPPGAPFFMILARFFAIFAKDSTQVAMMVNAMSGLASAFTILFLFWTIVHLVKKILVKDENNISNGNLIAIIGSGAVGALAYTFSDTFWFSAVEGEVYALSSLFTAFVFWAILKWENIADQKYSNRWLILIAYLMGISIGVHLLNLLAIPAIVMVYYYKKYNPSSKGIFWALVLSVVILSVIMYGIIPGIVKVATLFELMFVNGFGLPYNSGVFFYLALIIGLVVWGILYTHKKKKVILNTVILAFTVILIGYSSFTMIVIRSVANPPMDENDPENVFNLLHYLNREQYGDRPLFKGQYYNAPAVDSKERYTYRPKGGEYVKYYSLNPVYEFDKEYSTFFPRMYSSSPSHIKEYKSWAEIQGRKVSVTGPDGEKKIDYIPTFGENLKFFFRYQVGYMYLRYFMWNFAGRQNDTQGHGELMNGNWLSGIKFIDEARLGPQDNLPEKYKNNKARNKYYMLPLLLGIVGLIYHYKKHSRDTGVVMLLFLLTGLAIVVYLNQYPMQPRERDYAYAASFYAFAIWIGIGVTAIYDALRKKAPAVISAGLATIICLGFVPGIMAQQNWDDHDRSNRYIARDFAYNYLNSCAPNAIIFTHGDNDTFPLWYAQEVEGIRTDVRVVNLSLLSTDWYIDQMKRKAYESEPVPFSLTKEQYVQGRNDVVYVIKRVDEYTDLKRVIEFVGSDAKGSKFQAGDNEWIDYFPTTKFIVPIDSAAVVESGTVKPEDAHLIVPEIKWNPNKRRFLKSEMMMLDLIAHNNWERPVYFVSMGGDSNIKLNEYLQLDGFAYRLVPIKTEERDYFSTGRVDTDILYNKLMNVFKWGNMNDTDNWIDHTTARTTSVIQIRNRFTRLANELLNENKVDSAIAVLDRCQELMPKENFPYDLFTLGMIESYYKAGEIEKANALANEFTDICVHDLKYYLSLDAKFANSVDYDKRVAMHVLQQLNELAKRNKQTELNTKLEEQMTAIFTLLGAKG